MLVGGQCVKLPQVIQCVGKVVKQPVCVEGKQRCLWGSVVGKRFLEKDKQPGEVRFATRQAEILSGATAGGIGGRRADKETALIGGFYRVQWRGSNWRQ